MGETVQLAAGIGIAPPCLPEPKGFMARIACLREALLYWLEIHFQAPELELELELSELQCLVESDPSADSNGTIAQIQTLAPINNVFFGVTFWKVGALSLRFVAKQKLKIITMLRVQPL